jgi:hypothetical protein
MCVKEQKKYGFLIDNVCLSFKGYMMQNRTNYIFDHIVNKGIIICKFRGIVQANKMMKTAGIPEHIIERILFEPQKIRSGDWS